MILTTKRKEYKKGQSRVDSGGVPFYYSGEEIADYHVFKNPESSERVLVDNKGKITHSSLARDIFEDTITHSTLADILAWEDEKVWSQGQ